MIIAVGKLGLLLAYFLISLLIYIFVCGKKSVGICFEHMDLPKSCERQCPIEKRLIVISFRIYESSECFDCESPARKIHRAFTFPYQVPYGFGRDLNCNYRRRAGRWQKREADCRRLRELIAKTFRASEGVDANYAFYQNIKAGTFRIRLFSCPHSHHGVAALA